MLGISPYFSKGKFTERGREHVDSLLEELSQTAANIFVPLGPSKNKQPNSAAMCAVLCLDGVQKFRGYVFESAIDNRKAIPTYHPVYALHGNYIARQYIANDLKKVKEEAAFPELRRPQRELFTNLNFSQTISYLHDLLSVERLAYDIEVLQYEVSCISFAHSPFSAVSIPLVASWTLEEEVEIWKAISAVLQSPTITKVTQNGVSFDKTFLLARNGITVAGPQEDIMLAHHIMYPDMLKGLAFLGSLYCGSQEYWKDAIKFKNIKKES